MEGLSSLLLKAYPGKSKEELQAVRVFGAWAKALSTRILQNAQPVKLQNGTLTVHTATSAWANSLQLESDALIAAVQRRAPEVRLRKLVFRVGPLPNATTIVVDEPTSPGVVPAVTLPEDVARELARISDDGVREAVARAAAAGLGEVQSEEAAERARTARGGATRAKRQDDDRTDPVTGRKRA